MARKDAPAGFYVYELIDPRTDDVFYVGKGKGRRAWRHETAERAGRENNALKGEVLGQLRRAGLSALVRIVESGMGEEAAYRLERQMIVRGHKTLTNISLGQHSMMERVRAAARSDMAQIKTLCQVWRDGSDHQQLRVWASIVSGLARIATAGPK